MDGLPATQLPQARVCHLAHGRLRLKIPEKRRDEGFFDTVRKQLSGRDGIERVEVNPLTASVLLQFHDPDAAVAGNALKNDLFEVDFDALEGAVGPPALTEQAAEVFAQADAMVRHWTGNGADLRSAIFLALPAGSISCCAATSPRPPRHCCGTPERHCGCGMSRPCATGVPTAPATRWPGTEPFRSRRRCRSRSRRCMPWYPAACASGSRHCAATSR